MKNKLVFDNKSLHSLSKKIFITGCKDNKLIHKIFINSIGNIEIRETVTNVLKTDTILDNMYIENLLSNDIDVVKMTVEIIINKYNIK